MRRALILSIILFLVSPAMAQIDSVCANYDRIWKRLPDTTEAAFFRVVKDAASVKFLRN